MVLDYNEKRPGSKAERKPAPKNRPRREPIGTFALLSVLALVATFGAGVFTGWLVFKPKQSAAVPAAVQSAKQEEPAPAPAPANPAGDAPLTFYKTLPAGTKGTIGTGLNLKALEPPAAAKPAPGAAPAAPPATAPAPESAAPAPTGAAATPPAAGASGAAAGNQAKSEESVRYLVQIASYTEKKEADAAQAKLVGKGVAAYVVESRVADKGVWYRVRVGHKLTKAEAEQLAGKFGKGTIVLPE